MPSFTRRSLLAAAPAARFQAKPRPNLLLLLSDDHSYPYLGCYGQPWLKTPTLDGLAAEGMRFDRCFTTAPQCVPSRASLMTGRSAVAARMTRFSAPLPRDIVSFPELLREREYFTGVCGRHFHLDGPVQNKFTQTLMEKHRLKTFEDRVDFLDRGSPMPKTLDMISEFFRRCPTRRPWFLWVNFSDPHHVWNAPENPAPDTIPLPGHLPDLPGVREDLSKYCGEVQRLDGQVREVLGRIEQAASLDNTLIMFMGDNGMALPHGKGSLYDPGLNVPLLAHWKGVLEPGRSTRALISGEDIAPTFLDAAGLTPPAPTAMSGKSFAPLLRGEAYTPRTHVFAERGYHGNGAINANTAANTFDLSRCVRSDRYKLICNYTPKQRYMPVDSARDAGWQQMVAEHEAGRLRPHHDRAYFTDPRPMTELFDLDTDPSELNNLAGNPDVASVERALKEALQEKMLLDGDYLPLPLGE